MSSKKTSALTSANGEQMLALIAAMTGREPLGKVDVVREGKQIILPEGMSLREGIKWLQRKMEEEEREVRIHEDVDAFPFDGAYAFTKALSQLYGWVDLQPTPGFFGDQPPNMVGVQISLTETVQVPWGRIAIPNIEGYLESGVGFKDGRPIFKINGVVKQKHKEEVAKIATLTRQIVLDSSIYRSKAIRISFPGKDEDWDFGRCPEFLDLTEIDEGELIFPTEVGEAVKASLFNPIEHTDLCREHKIPLKRGILLEGPYGTGKTLTANVAAKKCEANGWTFLYLGNVDQLAQAVAFAQQYQPCMIFSEDIDQVLTGDRTESVNSILNIVDGIDSKGTEIVIVLTTNFVEKIDQAMLRPGRLDAVISVRHPDAEAAEKLLRLYGHDLIPEDEDLSEVGQVLEGKTPAVLREVVDRSKLAAIGRLEPGQELNILAKDLLVTAQGIENHLKLLEPKQGDNRSNIEKFGDTVGAHVVNGVERAVRQLGQVPPVEVSQN